jgi:hypothetical protein
MILRGYVGGGGISVGRDSRKSIKLGEGDGHL